MAYKRYYGNGGVMQGINEVKIRLHDVIENVGDHLPVNFEVLQFGVTVRVMDENGEIVDYKLDYDKDRDMKTEA